MGEAGYGMSAKDRETRTMMRLPPKTWEHMKPMEKGLTAAKLALGTMNPYTGVLAGLAGVGMAIGQPIAAEIGESWNNAIKDNQAYGWGHSPEGFARRMADPAARARYEQMRATAQMHYGAFGGSTADRQGGRAPVQRRPTGLGALGRVTQGPAPPSLNLPPMAAQGLGPGTGPSPNEGAIRERLRKANEGLFALGRVQA